MASIPLLSTEDIWRSSFSIRPSSLLKDWSVWAVALLGASVSALQAASLPDSPADTLPAPDYREAESWLARADAPDKPVDVFYVYPTVYNGTTPANMDVRDPALRAAAAHLLDTQASVFTPSANLYAPYYRQASFQYLDPAQDMFENPVFRVGAADVERAFEYYLEHCNDGRPFIIASHSQGTLTTLNLMRKYLRDPELQKRLVAAYLIGYSVMPEDFEKYPWIKPATGPTDTGVVISYNTQSPAATGSPVLKPGAFCINPLTWTTDEAPADKLLNHGAVFFADDSGIILREVPYYVGAQVDRASGALVCEPPDADLDIGHFPPGVYHKFDYVFWYRNLQDNVRARVESYLRQQDEQ